MSLFSFIKIAFTFNVLHDLSWLLIKGAIILFSSSILSLIFLFRIPSSGVAADPHTKSEYSIFSHMYLNNSYASAHAGSAGSAGVF